MSDLSSPPAVISGKAEVCTGEWVLYHVDNTISIPEDADIFWSIIAGSHRAAIVGPDNREALWLEVGERFGSFGLQCLVTTPDSSLMLHETRIVHIRDQGLALPVIQQKGNNILLVDQQQGPAFDYYQWGWISREDFHNHVLEEQNRAFCFFETPIQTQQHYYWVETSINGQSCIRRTFLNHPADSPVSVRQPPDKPGFMVYPVPASSQITVSWDNDNIPVREVWLTNTMGYHLATYRLARGTQTQELQINVTTLPRGTYILTLCADDMQYHQKVLLK